MPSDWFRDPFRDLLRSSRANLVFIAKAGLPPAILNILLRVAAFQNPEFYKAQSMRLSTYDKPRVIGCGDDLATTRCAAARFAWQMPRVVLERHSIEVRLA